MSLPLAERTPSPLSSSCSSNHNIKIKYEPHNNSSNNKTKSKKSLENNGNNKCGSKTVEKANKIAGHGHQQPCGDLLPPQQHHSHHHLTHEQKSPPHSQHSLLIQNQLSQFQSFLTNNINVNNSMYQHPASSLPPHQPPVQPFQNNALPLLNFQNFPNPKQCSGGGSGVGGWQEYMMAATSMANAFKNQHQHQQQQQQQYHLNNNNNNNNNSGNPPVPNPPINQALYQAAFTTLLKQISEMSHMKSIKEEASGAVNDAKNNGSREQDLSSISTSSTCSSNYDMNNNKQNISLHHDNADDQDYDEGEGGVEIEEGEIDPCGNENFDDYENLSEKDAMKKPKAKTVNNNSSNNSLFSSQSAAMYSSSSSSSTPPSSVSSNSSLCNNKIKLEANFDFAASSATGHETANGKHVVVATSRNNSSPSGIAKRNLKHSIDFILGVNANNEAARRRLENGKRRCLTNGGTGPGLFSNGSDNKKSKNIV
jgi:hypothetical protein